MRTEQNQGKEQQDTRKTHDQPENRPRLNPRLVFADPDSFFNDLLMEQQEQQ